jgi:hypothetical protein
MATKRNEREMDELFEERERSDDFYNEDDIELLLENDEISDEEEAFMMGYMDFDEE